VAVFCRQRGRKWHTGRFGQGEGARVGSKASQGWGKRGGTLNLAKDGLVAVLDASEWRLTAVVKRKEKGVTAAGPRLYSRDSTREGDSNNLAKPRRAGGGLECDWKLTKAHQQQAGGGALLLKPILKNLRKCH
jgi:hypothetical protein